MNVLITIHDKELVVKLASEVEYESETWDNVKRLAKLCKNVIVDTLRLREGRCEPVRISTSKIEILRATLKSGNDVNGLYQLVSQYQSWSVWDLHLTELGFDDCARLAQLLPTLKSAVYGRW